MRRKFLIGLLFSVVLSGCTFTDEEGKQQTIDLDFNHHVQFQRMPKKEGDGMDTTLDSFDACSEAIPVNTLVLLHGDEFGSEVNARPAPSSDKWYDPPIMATVGDSVRVLGKEGDWYRSRWVTPGSQVLISYFHCSLIKEPVDD